MKKKNLILIALLLLGTHVVAQNGNTVLTGKLAGLKADEWIYLESFTGGGAGFGADYGRWLPV